MSARSVTLVFSSYYLNNPASAFGHTFLRLNKTEAPRSGRHFELLDQGVNYAATADTGNAILYAFKGLTGLFRGEFTALPYFYKVREYAEYESRDIWEYDLALEPAQVALLVAHVWEMGSTWFDYYYLTENCSYHLLGLLEAAAPDLDLLSRVGRVVLPGDTVLAVWNTPGLVREVHFRPSVRTQLRRRLAGLPESDHEAVGLLAGTPGTELPDGLADAERARVLDAALDLFDVRNARVLVGASDAGVDADRQALLLRRSAVPVQSEPLANPMPALGAPHLAHGSARFALGFGASSASGPIVVLDWRPALHDLADPPLGYPTQAQIEFISTRLRYEPRHNALRLEELTLMDVVSFSGLDRLDPRASWHLRVGATTLRDGGCASCLAGAATVGGGAAWTSPGEAAAAVLTADVQLVAAPGLDGTGGTRLRLGLGPTGLVRLLGGERLAFLATGSWLWHPASTPRSTYALGLVGRLHLGRVSLSLEARKAPLEWQGLLAAQLFY